MLDTNRIAKWFMSCLLLLALIPIAGCFDLNPLIPAGTVDDSGSSSAESTNTNQSQVSDSTQTAIDILSPQSDVTIFVGKPVLISWAIDNVPTNPTMDVLYSDDSVPDAAAHTFVSNLPTSQLGSVQVDTSNLVPNHTYTITLRLKSSGTEILTQQAPGKIIVSRGTLDVSKPDLDVSILPSESYTVNWSGTYLPANSTLDIFLDIDRDSDNGNEVILSSKSKTLSTGGTQSGSIDITGQDIIDNAQTNVSYFIGLRIIKDGQKYLVAYAPGTLRLYPGTGLIVLSPSSDTSVSWGDTFTVSWSHNGVPNNITLKIILKDTADSSETLAADNVAVTLGQKDIDTDDLQLNHQYEIILRAYDGTNQIAEVSASGKITIGTGGINIQFTNDDLNQGDRKLYLGADATYTINWKVSAAPTDAKVRLFVSADRNIATTDEQVEITPNGGVSASAATYDFTPNYDDFKSFADRDFYLLAQLVSADGEELAQTASTAIIHIGDGSVELTAPSADETHNLGEQVTVQWNILNGFCSRDAGSIKTLRLYADEVPYYRQGLSIELTDTDGVNVCGGVSSYTFDTDKLSPAKTYYIIARLFVEGRTEPEHQAVAAGKIVVSEAEFNVLTPEKVLLPSELSSINVTWEITGIELTGKKVRIYAEKEDASDAENPIISPAPPAGDYDASAGAGTADASKLPPGTYKIKCVLFDIDDDGNEVIRATAYAKGKIVINAGYNGTFDLADMENGDKVNYSPLDGAIFTGFNIDDQAGYQVAGLGDLDGDGHGDFLIFSRYGQEYTVGKAGSAYLIYGSSNIGGQPNDEGKIFSISLNSIPDILNSNPQVDGTLLLFPLENLAWDDGGDIRGVYKAIALPDISGDGEGDLLISAPEASPLTLQIINNSSEDVNYTDPYGIQRTIPTGGDTDPGEPMHVYPRFRMTLRNDNWTNDDTGAINGSEEAYITVNFMFGYEPDIPSEHIYFYKPGDVITIGFRDDTQVVGTNTYTRVVYQVTKSPAKLKRGAVYWVTSNFLDNYRNRIYDLTKIGSPVEDVDGNSEAANTMMITSQDENENFGSHLAVIPDIDGDNRPELLIGAITADPIDIATGNFTTARADAGAVGVYDSYDRFTDIAPDPVTPTGEGHIAWDKMASLMIGLTGSPVSVDEAYNSITILGPADNSHLSSAVGLGRFSSLNGRSEYAGGDFNGDGYPEIIVGAPGEQVNGNADAGAIYMIFGRPIMGRRAPIIDLADFNQPLPPGTDPDLQSPVIGIKISGISPGQNLGERIKAAGDFNGDGLADFIIGMPDDGAGKIIIIFGQENVVGDFDYSDIGTSTSSAIKGLTFVGESAGDQFGKHICAVYDFNGDGVDDILVSAPYASATGKTHCGKVYLIYGRKNIIKTDYASQEKYVDYDGDKVADSDWSADDIGSNLPGVIFVGARADDNLSAVAFAGDVNGDGIGDILLGAPGADIEDNTVQQNAGRAYLILGRRFDPWQSN